MSDTKSLGEKAQELQKDEEQAKADALMDAATPEKKVRCYLHISFLPGDGSPRIIPAAFRITQRSYDVLEKLKNMIRDEFQEVVESGRVPDFDTVKYLTYTWVGKGQTEAQADEKEQVEVVLLQSPRILGWSIERYEYDGSIILADESDAQLDQSGGPGTIGSRAGGAGLVDLDGNPISADQLN